MPFAATGSALICENTIRDQWTFKVGAVCLLMVVSAGLKPERVLSKRNVDQSPEAAWAGWYLIRAREGPIPITHKMIAVRTNCDLSKRFMPVLLPYQDQEKTCYLSSVISLSDLILKGEMYIRENSKVVANRSRYAYNFLFFSASSGSNPRVTSPRMAQKCQ